MTQLLGMGASPTGARRPVDAYGLQAMVEVGESLQKDWVDVPVGRDLHTIEEAEFDRWIGDQDGPPEWHIVRSASWAKFSTRPRRAPW